MKKALAGLLVGMILLSITSYGFASNDPFAGMLVYEEGQYKVGRDFLAGEYVLLCTSSSYSAYFSISTDANGRNIVANDMFDTNSIITVLDGEYLELSRCVAVHALDFYTTYTIKLENDGTMLKVGYDIMPGEYKLIASSGQTGYYCIYNDSRHTKVVDNNLFNNSAWVTVQYGQYLVLNRCHIQ